MTPELDAYLINILPALERLLDSGQQFAILPAGNSWLVLYLGFRNIH